MLVLKSSCRAHGAAGANDDPWLVLLVHEIFHSADDAALHSGASVIFRNTCVMDDVRVVINDHA
jgi:hypothetical protein